jgi:hypothetical protein
VNLSAFWEWARWRELLQRHRPRPLLRSGPGANAQSAARSTRSARRAIAHRDEHRDRGGRYRFIEYLPNRLLAGLGQYRGVVELGGAVHDASGPQGHLDPHIPATHRDDPPVRVQSNARHRHLPYSERRRQREDCVAQRGRSGPRLSTHRVCAGRPFVMTIGTSHASAAPASRSAASTVGHTGGSRSSTFVSRTHMLSVVGPSAMGMPRATRTTLAPQDVAPARAHPDRRDLHRRDRPALISQGTNQGHTATLGRAREPRAAAPEGRRGRNGLRRVPES